MPIRIKSAVPLWLKKPMWHALKSPQRDGGILKSWLTEIRGRLQIGLHRRRAVDGVSICTGLMNRSQNFLDYVLPSLMKMAHQDKIELCIFDCGSTDMPDLEDHIRSHWGGALRFKAETVEFNRASAFNRAVELSSQPLIFICDADMSLPEDLVEQCNRYVTNRSVWFPVCFWLYRGQPAVVSSENGEWWPRGKGMLSARRTQWAEVGGFAESFTKWGGEDWDLWTRFWKAGYYAHRTHCLGLFHHWHQGFGGGKGRGAE